MILPSVSLFPIGSEPYGLSYGVWSVKWWRWLLSISKAISPVLDATGESAAINQNDPNVFFLCQTMDSIKNMGSTSGHRRIIVKDKSSILMPIINWISVSPEDGDDEQDLATVAAAKMNVVSRLEITVNGIKVDKGLEKYRARSPIFDLILPKDNILELPAGPRRFVSDGYWLFFTLLEKNIKLSTFGSCSSGANRFLVNYEITKPY